MRTIRISAPILLPPPAVRASADESSNTFASRRRRPASVDANAGRVATVVQAPNDPSEESLVSATFAAGERAM